MSDRKLAHIERVIDVQPIVGADNIEVATVLGWKCVVKKDTVKVGSLVCYVEVDSIVPATSYFDFIKDRRYRVRTIKLRKQISQGLVIPLVDLHAITNDYKDYKEGEDVTSVLGITKYESPSEIESNNVYVSRKKHNWFIRYMTRFQWFRKMFKTKSKSWPNWLAKTDEERLQNIPWILKDKKHQFYITEKLDGQSGTYWYRRTRCWTCGVFHKEFGICSRSVRKFEWDGSNWSVIAKQLNIKNKLKKCGKNIAIQGEVVGVHSDGHGAIQGNKYKLKNLDFYIFNIYDINKHTYYNYDDILIFCSVWGFKPVPLLYKSFILPDTVDEMLKLSEGNSIINPSVLREGIVVRTDDKSISFKVVNPQFLLKHNE